MLRLQSYHDEYTDLKDVWLERDWDAALIEQSLREAIFVVDSLVYLSASLTKQQKDQLWAYRQKWARVLEMET